MQSHLTDLLAAELRDRVEPRDLLVPGLHLLEGLDRRGCMQALDLRASRYQELLQPALEASGQDTVLGLVERVLRRGCFTLAAWLSRSVVAGHVNP